jgi:enoyl-CoA hydratase
MRNDHLSFCEQWSLSLQDVLGRDSELGIDVIASGKTQVGAARFVSGRGRHGSGVESFLFGTMSSLFEDRSV